MDLEVVEAEEDLVVVEEVEGKEKIKFGVYKINCFCLGIVGVAVMVDDQGPIKKIPNSCLGYFMSVLFVVISISYKFHFSDVRINTYSVFLYLENKF